MALRKIIRAPFLFKKTPIFKQGLCTLHHACQAKTIASDNKSFAFENTTEDKIAVNLNTPSLSKIVLILEKNKKLINGSHIVLAMKKFHKLSKKIISDQEYEAKAKEMFSVVDMNIDKLSVTESVEVLNIFCKMKVASSTKVMQSLLKHINDYINEITLVDFRKLSSRLKQMPDSRLTENLHNTLERKFIVQVETEFNPDNIDHLESTLHFTAYNLNNYKLLKLCINGLNNYKGEISSNNATSIFHSLCLMKKYPPGWLDLMHRIQNILIKEVDELNLDQVSFILFLIGEKCRLDRMDEFYNESLCKVLVNKIVTDDSGFETALSALKSLSYIRFVSTELLNYACAAYFERMNLSSEIVEDIFFKLMTLISSLSAIKHKTVFFEDIKDCVLNNTLLLNCDYETLCILTLNLLNLDCYPTNLLSKLFDSKGNFREQRSFLQWTFCKVYQKIKTNPTYKGQMPSESQIASLKKFHYRCYLHKKKTFNDRILYCLEKGMGGASYVKSNISTKLFHIIDHFVAFSKDGTPISINSDTITKFDSVEYVEDFKLPPESQIVLILFMPRFWYSRNTKELFSTYSCIVETLEALSYTVVDVNESTWDETPIEERTNLLMNKIRSKLVLN